MEVNDEVKKSFVPLFIHGNERNVYDAMFTMSNYGGSVQEIIDIYPGFRRGRVEKAIRGLVKKGLVVYSKNLSRYVIT